MASPNVNDASSKSARSDGVVTASTDARPTSSPSRRPSVRPVEVTALLVLRDRDDLAAAIAGVSEQTRAVDRVLLVDGTLHGLADLDEVRDSLAPTVAQIATARIDGAMGLRRALSTLVADLPVTLGETPPESDPYVWFLTSRARPHPDTLTRLTEALARGVAMVAPALMNQSEPTRFVRRGLQVTRFGRLVAQPPFGEVDQGQYDVDVDVLAAPLDGLLISQECYLALGGHDPSLGDLGADLDLGWRSQRAAGRVVIAPGAIVEVEPTPSERQVSDEHRRQARRVALARCSWWAAPFIALWLLVQTIGIAFGLLVLKRPAQARAELATMPALADPRVLAARWRGKSARGVSRRDLAGLFVPARDGWRRLVDEYRGVDPGRGGVDARSLEHERSGTLRHPLLYLSVVVIAMSAVAGRSIVGAIRQDPGAGLLGGQLLGGRAESAGLFALWRDGWNGPGWGAAAEQSPAVVLLAGASWVIERIPGLDNVSSPAGVALTALLVVALPLAAASAYGAARVLGAGPWWRALAALAWVSGGAIAGIIGEGRIGAIVAVILLPRLGAGLVRASRGDGTFSGAVRTALWAGVLGWFIPILAVLMVVVGLAWTLIGGGPRRQHGWVLALIPVAMAGPWLTTLIAEPAQLFAGWGVLAPRAETAAWLQAVGTAGMHPSPATWLAIPMILAAALALLLPGRRPLAWSAGALVVVGVLFALAAPRITLATVPPGQPDAGAVMTVWPGIGTLLATLGLITLALSAVPAVATEWRAGWRSVTWVPAAAVIVGVLGSAGLLAWQGFGSSLQAWRDPRPPVAVEHAEGPLAGRSVEVWRDGDGISYRIIGREPAPLVRGIPAAAAPGSADDRVRAALAQALGVGEEQRSAPSETLARVGIGYIVVHRPSAKQSAELDSLAGFARLGETDHVTTWSVRSLSDGHPPSRIRLAREDSSLPITSVRDHAALSAPERVSSGGTLEIAESADWAVHAVVRADGASVPLSTKGENPSYSIPGGTQSVDVDVAIGHPVWKGLSVLILLIALYLALPTEQQRQPKDER